VTKLNSICVRLNGGLGNQLFQFAAGYSLARKMNSNLIMDSQLYMDESRKGFNRCCEIQNIVDAKYFSFAQSIMFKPSFIWKIKRLLLILLYTIKLHKYKFIRENKSGFDLSFFSLPDKNLYLDGYWQSEKYFYEFRHEIKEILHDFFHYPAEHMELYGGINLNNSVCVDIRKGDYVSSRNKLIVHGELSERYYERAVSKMEELLEDPIYFIFSDNRDYIPLVFSSRNCRLIDPQHFGSDYHNKLRLMTLCNNFILPNSTFSWWAAYMSSNKHKIIIGPDKWVRNRNNLFRMPSSWMKIESYL